MIQAGNEFLRYTSSTSPNRTDLKSTRLNSSHLVISYAVFCLKKKQQFTQARPRPRGGHAPSRFARAPRGAVRAGGLVPPRPARRVERGLLLACSFFFIHGATPDISPLSLRDALRI